ncbi:MAG TPA: alpha/beta hydrolase [Polyangiaceae bacterium]|nr:alpha/beta hydrolase [Polyangiaceae bacterium]
MRRRLATAARLAACLLAPGACGPTAPAAAPSLAFEPCTLGSPGSPFGLAARCATLEVPEDRANPAGRKVRLAVAVVPSTAERPEPDPVFFLAGGPGEAARVSFAGVAPAFREVLERRDVVLVDQRGTGGSNALACRNAAGAAGAAGAAADPFAAPDAEDPAALKAFAAGCLAGLDADVRFYTTGEAVADLEAVREALGAPAIDLVGVSYGTRVAQEYVRRHPGRVRAVVLDGVVPPGLVLGAEFARNLDDALALASRRCEADEACRRRFGAPREALGRLLERARREPPAARFRDPLGGGPREEKLGAGQVAAVARLFSYAPKLAALLPLAVDEALAGRPEALAAQAAMVEGLLGGSIVQGMQLSVVCSEDVDLLAPDPADDATVLGGGFVRATRAQCEAWPKGRRAPDFHAPLASDVPALLLSGELDPVTPPRYGERVAATLPRGRHLVARGQGHHVGSTGCLPKLVAAFLRGGDARTLDASCLDRLGPTPPFEGPHGWGP